MSSELITHCDVCGKLIKTGEKKWNWKIEGDSFYFRYGDICEDCIEMVEKILNIKHDANK